MSVAAAEDCAALELLSTTYALRRRLHESLRSAGSETYHTPTATGGTMVRLRPEVGALSDVDRRLLVLLGRFGLTPADRARVGALGGPAACTPDDEFASGG